MHIASAPVLVYGSLTGQGGVLCYVRCLVRAAFRARTPRVAGDVLLTARRLASQ